MSGDPFDMDDDPERTVIQPRRAGSPSPADEDKTVLGGAAAGGRATPRPQPAAAKPASPVNTTRVMTRGFISET